MQKSFSDYDKAYELYSDIVSGRDKDRKNASIFFVPSSWHGTVKIPAQYIVEWEPIISETV